MEGTGQDAKDEGVNFAKEANNLNIITSQWRLYFKCTYSFSSSLLFSVLFCGRVVVEGGGG